MSGVIVCGRDAMHGVSTKSGEISGVSHLKGVGNLTPYRISGMVMPVILR